MDACEQYVADKIECLLACSSRPLRCVAKSIPDGGYEVVVGGEVPETMLRYPSVKALSLVTGYPEAIIEVEVDRETHTSVIWFMADEERSI